MPTENHGKVTTKQLTTLGTCLLQLAEQRVRPTAVLYLYLGKLEWMSSSQLRERLTTSRTLDGSWDAFLITFEEEAPPDLVGIYLFGPDGKAYRALEIAATQAALTQEATCSQHNQTGHCTVVVHPEYDFLTFDDLRTPKKMTVWLTSLRFESDLEDNRRCGIAQEIKWALKERDCSLEVTFERETKAPVVSNERTIAIEESDL